MDSHVPLNTHKTRLSRGINIGGWFALGHSSDPKRVQTFIGDRDIQTIKGLGFDHVRIPINPKYFLDENHPAKLKPEYLGYLDDALHKLQSSGLAAIIDLHGGTPFKKRLAKDDNFVNIVSQFWQALAQHLSRLSPDKVYLEVLNEPDFEALLGDKELGRKRWSAVEQKLIAAIEQGAPNHTIITSGADLDSIRGLKARQPLADNHVLYAFHFYDPKVFTHQGAAWISDLKELSNIPYPNDTLLSNAHQEALSSLDRPLNDRVTNYYKGPWNVSTLEAKIASVASWAREHGVGVIADEFGAYKLNASAEDRAAWIHDTRSLLEKYQIGWTMWDYTGGFGLTDTRTNGHRPVDRAIAGALGLTIAHIS